MTKKYPLVIGHRGACGYAPENTMTSFRKAYELGVKWIEFDVMLSNDSEAIIIHDTDLARTTQTSGEVTEFTYQQLAELDAGSWFGPEYSHERIPTFANVLNFLQEFKISAVVEIKPPLGKEIDTAEKVVNIVQNHHSEQVADIIISSFSPKSLRTARNRMPNQHLGLAVDNWDVDWKSLKDELGFQSLHVNHQILDQKKIEEIKEQELLIFAYTVNDEKRANELFSWGLDAIFSDFPDKLLPKPHPI